MLLAHSESASGDESWRNAADRHRAHKTIAPTEKQACGGTFLSDSWVLSGVRVSDHMGGPGMAEEIQVMHQIARDPVLTVSVPRCREVERKHSEAEGEREGRRQARRTRRE